MQRERGNENRRVPKNMWDRRMARDKERGRKKRLAPVGQRVSREGEACVGPDGHVGVGVDVGVPEERKEEKWSARRGWVRVEGEMRWMLTWRCSRRWGNPEIERTRRWKGRSVQELLEREERDASTGDSPLDRSRSSPRLLADTLEHSRFSGRKEKKKNESVSDERRTETRRKRREKETTHQLRGPLQVCEIRRLESIRHSEVDNDRLQHRIRAGRDEKGIKLATRSSSTSFVSLPSSCLAGRTFELTIGSSETNLCAISVLGFGPIAAAFIVQVGVPPTCQVMNPADRSALLAWYSTP